MDLFDLVIAAQNGDISSLQQIIQMFKPAIKNERRKISINVQDDLEQQIIETIIQKILKYDYKLGPDFKTFCENITP